MWIIVPLAPIAIALFLLAGGVFGELQSSLHTINTIVIILNVLIFGGIGIANLFCSISTTKKVLSTICCSALGTLSGLVLNGFINALAAIKLDPLGVFEFAFVLLMGGCLVLLVVIGCIMACAWFGDY